MNARYADFNHNQNRARTFTQIARCFALGGSIGGARREADKLGLVDAGEIMKAATAAVPLAEAGTYAAVSAAWLTSLRNTASSAILAASVGVPRMVRAGIVTQIEASGVAEGAAKSVNTFQLTPDSIPALKAATIVVMTRELAESPDFPTQTLDRELRAGVTAATDGALLTSLLSGATSISATGTFEDDARALLAAVPRGEGSRPIFIGGTTARDEASLVPESQRRPGRLPVAGGAATLLDLPFFSSSALDAGTLALVDASAIVSFDEGIRVDGTTQASLEMDTDPGQLSTSPPTEATSAVVSLWQTNSVGVRAERRFGALLMRDDAIAQLTGLGQGSPTVNW